MALPLVPILLAGVAVMALAGSRKRKPSAACYHATTKEQLDRLLASHQGVTFPFAVVFYPAEFTAEQAQMLCRLTERGWTAVLVRIDNAQAWLDPNLQAGATVITREGGAAFVPWGDLVGDAGAPANGTAASLHEQEMFVIFGTMSTATTYGWDLNTTINEAYAAIREGRGCPAKLDPDDPAHAECVALWLWLRDFITPRFHQTGGSTDLPDWGDPSDIEVDVVVECHPVYDPGPYGTICVPYPGGYQLRFMDVGPECSSEVAMAIVAFGRRKFGTTYSLTDAALQWASETFLTRCPDWPGSDADIYQLIQQYDAAYSGWTPEQIENLVSRILRAGA